MEDNMGNNGSEAPFSRVIQVGIVVEDVEKSVEEMRKVFGVEPDFVKDMNYPRVTYRGKPVNVIARVAAYSQFGVQLEFMQPIGDDDSSWQDHLNEQGSSALHHIRFNDIEDSKVANDYMKEKGIEIYQEGESVVTPGGKFIYYDTADRLGFVVEVVSKK